jgi:hypothetical protein
MAFDHRVVHLRPGEQFRKCMADELAHPQLTL